MPTQDPNIFGPFEPVLLLGATVSEFSITSGWGSQQSFANFTIVEDPLLNQDFLLKEGNAIYNGGQGMAMPISFTYGELTFAGIVKSVEQINDPGGGNPIFHLTASGPQDILDATQIILDGYIGSTNDTVFNGSPQTSGTFQVSNLINVYGYAEGGGQNFGRSLETQVGLPWINNGYGISESIQTLTNTSPESITDPTQNFGSYLNYKGYLYRVDLSNLPIPPSFYRFGGTVNMSLSDLIAKYMEDAGLMYQAKLTLSTNGGPNVISFIVVTRYIQQQLGQIAQYIAAQQNIATVTRGQELRSDITQAFLVGGAVNTLQPLTNSNGFNLVISPFWGFDINGNAIIGAKPDGTKFADDDYQMVLNGSSIADILGELGIGVNYSSSILELRCALGGYDSWVAYLRQFQPNLAGNLGLYTAFDTDNAPNAQAAFDLINDAPGLAEQLGNMWGDNHWPAVAQRLYEFVLEVANTYYGKKFLVQLPFDIQLKIDPNTDVISFNDEIADAGFIPEGTDLLGLNFVNENYFLDQTGRFYPFVSFNYTNIFNSIAGQRTVVPNMSYLKGSAAVIQYDNFIGNTRIFTRCEQGEAAPILQNGLIGGGSQILFVNNGLGGIVPAVVVTVPDAIWAQANDITGSTDDVAALLNITGRLDVLSNDGEFQSFTAGQVLQNILSLRTTSFNFVIHPPAIYPDGVCIAIKSNQFVYGPWGKFNVNGKIEFEQDDGLVPWEYGGYDVMSEAANAKINTIAMGNQVLERGDWEEAGLPKASIGDYLVEDGPILTDISCVISPSKVVTNYSMQTFVNRAGAFIFENQLRLQQIGKIYQQIRRTLRQLIISTNQQASIYNSAYKGFMFGTTYAIEQHTPHAVIGSNLIYGSGGNYIPQAFFQTPQESLANMGVNNPINYQSSACVSAEAVFRPFTMQQDDYYMSPYMFADSGGGNYDSSNLITSNLLNPFVTGCDLNWIISGTSYLGMKPKLGVIDWTSARSIALRLPIMQGWGYDIAGSPVPNSANTTTSGGITYPNFFSKMQDNNGVFFPGYLQQSIYWPTGPLDLRWNKFTGTWAGLGMQLAGTISGSNLDPGGTASMVLYYNDEPTDEWIEVGNFFSSQITSGTKVQACYNPMNNRWMVNSADCPNS